MTWYLEPITKILMKYCPQIRSLGYEKAYARVKDNMGKILTSIKNEHAISKQTHEEVAFHILVYIHRLMASGKFLALLDELSDETEETKETEDGPINRKIAMITTAAIILGYKYAQEESNLFLSDVCCFKFPEIASGKALLRFEINCFEGLDYQLFVTQEQVRKALEEVGCEQNQEVIEACQRCGIFQKEKFELSNANCVFVKWQDSNNYDLKLTSIFSQISKSISAINKAQNDTQLLIDLKEMGSTFDRLWFANQETLRGKLKEMVDILSQGFSWVFEEPRNKLQQLLEMKEPIDMQIAWALMDDIFNGNKASQNLRDNLKGLIEIQLMMTPEDSDHQVRLKQILEKLSDEKTVITDELILSINIENKRIKQRVEACLHNGQLIKEIQNAFMQITDSVRGNTVEFISKILDLLVSLQNILQQLPGSLFTKYREDLQKLIEEFSNKRIEIEYAKTNLVIQRALNEEAKLHNSLKIAKDNLHSTEDAQKNWKNELYKPLLNERANFLQNHLAPILTLCRVNGFKEAGELKKIFHFDSEDENNNIAALKKQHLMLNRFENALFEKIKNDKKIQKPGLFTFLGNKIFGWYEEQVNTYRKLVSFERTVSDRINKMHQSSYYLRLERSKKINKDTAVRIESIRSDAIQSVQARKVEKAKQKVRVCEEELLKFNKDVSDFKVSMQGLFGPIASDDKSADTVGQFPQVVNLSCHP